MKKAGLLILILLTAYIGGIYEDPALMALAVAELLLAVVMWLLAGYMAGRLELQIPAARILAVRGQTFQCRVTVKSRGILPVSRFVVRIGSRYEGGGRTRRYTAGPCLARAGCGWRRGLITAASAPFRRRRYGSGLKRPGRAGAGR